MRICVFTIVISVSLSAQTKTPKIWDDAALEDWATPIAAIGVRPGHFTSAEYYAAPADNLKTYPVYRPDREPPGYWEWLQKQKPQPLVNASKIHTREDWIKAGEAAFQDIDRVSERSDDPALVATFRNLNNTWDGVWTRSDGSLLMRRWVVTETGVKITMAECAGCHARPRTDGSVFWAAALAPVSGPRPRVDSFPASGSLGGGFPLFAAGPLAIALHREFTVPWAPDERVENYPSLGVREAQRVRGSTLSPRGVWARTHGSPYYMSKIPDLNTIQYSRYVDATGTHRLRGPEDVARYAAFVMGSDPMEFGEYKILKPDERRVSVRYADEVWYAIALYLTSLEPPRNPEIAAADLILRGREIFTREKCVQCHVPPKYTTGKLTLAQGFTPPANHPNKADIVKISVGTDPGLAMKTRKGTGFYKIPSLRGLWYRPLLLHDGSVASLEEMFDLNRLKPEHVPGGWKGPGVTNRAIPGHPFGLALNAEDKQALLAFLRSL